MNSIKNYINEMKSFFILWFGQAISLLGSTMTGCAITIWAYEKTGSVLVLSLSGILLMVPKMIIGILAGPFVDRANKKAVMIITDIGAGLCTLILYCLLRADSLAIWHIYCLNIANSILSSFQTPAANVAVSMVVPAKHYVRANGMQSFSDGLTQMLAPIFAAILLGMVGIEGVVVADFVTMAFACITLFFFVKLPAQDKMAGSGTVKRYYGRELLAGFKTLQASQLLRYLMLFMIFINFASGIAYFSLLSPMILARTGNDYAVLSLVNGTLGLGSVIGGLLTLVLPTDKGKAKRVFICAALSFFFGDIFFALGGTLPVWIIAAFASSVFIPLLSANEQYFWRTIIPIELQGRAFSFKYAFQAGVIPLGSLLGGLLADYVLEPFMEAPPAWLANVFGSGGGEGMALLFFAMGFAGVVISLTGYFSPKMKRLEAELDSKPEVS